MLRRPIKMIFPILHCVWKLHFIKFFLSINNNISCSRIQGERLLHLRVIFFCIRILICLQLFIQFKLGCIFCTFMWILFVSLYAFPSLFSRAFCCSLFNFFDIFCGEKWQRCCLMLLRTQRSLRQTQVRWEFHLIAEAGFSLSHFCNFKTVVYFFMCLCQNDLKAHEYVVVYIILHFICFDTNQYSSWGIWSGYSRFE